MTELDPHETGIDNLLRRSMSAPAPTLPPNFDQRVMRELSQGSRRLDRYRTILLACYGLISVVVSAAIMRSQGLNWTPIAITILGPLALLAAASWAWRASQTTASHRSF